MIYTFQLRNRFRRIGNELNHEFRAVASEIPVSDISIDDAVGRLRRDAPFRLEQWRNQVFAFNGLSNILSRKYDVLFSAPKSNVRRPF